jgi:hypothetical protein
MNPGEYGPPRERVSCGFPRTIRVVAARRPPEARRVSVPTEEPPLSMRVAVPIRLSRLLKKAHLRRPTFGGYPRARAALRRTDQLRLAPAPILRMGTRRAALHMDLFEQPGQKRVFQHPVTVFGRFVRAG